IRPAEEAPEHPERLRAVRLPLHAPRSHDLPKLLAQRLAASAGGAPGLQRWFGLAGARTLPVTRGAVCAGADPGWGVRNLKALSALAAACGLGLEERVELPAHHPLRVLRRPAAAADRAAAPRAAPRCRSAGRASPARRAAAGCPDCAGVRPSPARDPPAPPARPARSLLPSHTRRIAPSVAARSSGAPRPAARERAPAAPAAPPGWRARALRSRSHPGAP